MTEQLVPDKPGEAKEKENPTCPANKAQGEGDYEAARRYNDSARAFAESVDVEKVARDAAPHSAAEATELERAETDARSHAKEEDPLLHDPVGLGSPDDSDAAIVKNNQRP